MTDKTELYIALCAAQGAAEAITKGEQNPFGKYNYVPIEVMIHEAKKCLVPNGLAIVPISSRLEVTGTDGVPAIQHQIWLVTHTSGQSLVIRNDWPVVPNKGMPMDKATAAADSSGLKYTLRDLLQFPATDPGTELDDPKRDHRNPKNAAEDKPTPKPEHPGRAERKELTQGEILHKLDLANSTKLVRQIAKTHKKQAERDGWVERLQKAWEIKEAELAAGLKPEGESDE